MDNKSDIEKRKKRLIDYFGTAMISGIEEMGIELIDIEDATEEEIEKKEKEYSLGLKK